MSGYLLDTATLIETLRASPSPRLVQRLSEVPSRERWTSVITVSQLLVAARARRDTRLMQDVLRLVAAVRVAAYDLAAAQRFAKYRAGAAREDEAEDVMIAAIAATRGFTLVTNRGALFGRYPELRCEDWL